MASSGASALGGGGSAIRGSCAALKGGAGAAGRFFFSLCLPQELGGVVAFMRDGGR